jgi:hypothetical protein
MTQDEIIEMSRQVGYSGPSVAIFTIKDLQEFAKLVAQHEREAIYELVMEAPFKEFDRQEEEFDGESANAMKAMAFSLTSAIRARGSDAA